MYYVFPLLILSLIGVYEVTIGHVVDVTVSFRVPALSSWLTNCQ